MKVLTWLCILLLLQIACATGLTAVQSGVITHSGDSKAFVSVTCTVVDVRDSDQTFDTRSFLSKRFAARGSTQCSSQQQVLRIAYTAGPAVCIDCGVSDGYSGFALISISGPGEREIASFEWHGSGASSARELAERFAADIYRLSR